MSAEHSDTVTVIIMHVVFLFSASRAKLSAVNSISKLRGQAKNALYPQPEGQLGECMIRYGNELGNESEFGKYLLVVSVQVNFVPL